MNVTRLSNMKLMGQKKKRITASYSSLVTAWSGSQWYKLDFRGPVWYIFLVEINELNDVAQAEELSDWCF